MGLGEAVGKGLSGMTLFSISSSLHGTDVPVKMQQWFDYTEFCQRECPSEGLFSGHSSYVQMFAASLYVIL